MTGEKGKRDVTQLVSSTHHEHTMKLRAGVINTANPDSCYTFYSQQATFNFGFSCKSLENENNIKWS